jgi:hypothetical protein
MGLSETIVAAVIGAGATMLTAMFQLGIALRAKAKSETRPKRSSMRPFVAVFAMLIASAVGGYAYSELRAERVREDTRELRTELSKQLQALALSTAKLELLGDERAEELGLGALVKGAAPDQVIESVIHVPPCQPTSQAAGNEPANCSESAATSFELCGDIPASATVTAIELYARDDRSIEGWEKSGVVIDRDFGGGRFQASSFAYPADSVTRAVCTRLVHWNSEHGHMARMVVRYTLTPPMVASQATVVARP